MSLRSRTPAAVAWGLAVLLVCPGGVAVATELSIEGRVRLASGQAAAGVQVRLYDLSDPTRSLGVATDEAGYFSLAPPRPAGETDALPRRFGLFQNYPNPFNPATIIPYQLPAPAHVRLEVFNLLGQRVATLVDEEQKAGLHTAAWNGTDAAGRPVAAGLYLYRLSGSRISGTRRMVLLDGPVAVPGAASAPGVPAESEAPEPVYGLTVSGPGVVTHVDPDFRAGPWPVEIVVEARAGASGRAMKAAASGSRILGDVDANGRVDLLDAILVALYSIDPTTTLPNDGDISLGDVNRDGRVDVADVYLIATYSVDPGDPSLPSGIGQPLVVVLEGKMYWVDRWTAKIQRANLDGSEVEDLVTTGLEEPTDLALDVAGGKMYWTDRLTDKIKRANLDGSRIEDLVTGIYSIWSLALDVDGGKMYWTNASWRGPRVQRANLDGSQVEDLVTTGLRQIAGMALDVPGGKMYWTDYGTNKIHRANLDGSRVEDLVTTGLHGPWGLALDLAGGKMYWADWITNQILRANLDGSLVEELLTRPDNTGSLVLVVPDGKMYWTEGAWSDQSIGRILRSNLDGSQVEVLLATGLRTPEGLALDLPGLPQVTVNRPPVLDPIGKQSLQEGETLRIDLVGRDPEGTEVVFEAQSDDPGIARVSLSGRQLTVSPAAPGEARVTVTARDAGGVSTTQDFLVTVTEPVPESRGWMYWTDAGTDKIQRANLNGSQVEDLLTTGLDGPWGIALDGSGKMYWVENRTNKIQRANLDGSGVEDVITTGHSPKTVALDVSGGKMYWTDEGGFIPGRIVRANLDGSRVEEFGSQEALGIALDLGAGKLYWTDTGKSCIGRTPLYGSWYELLVKGLNRPSGLALDLAGGKMYWTDPGTVRIQRANLDGTQVENLVFHGIGRLTIGLALDLPQGKMYWVDVGTKKIQRANLDGTRVEDLVTGLSEPRGLALEIMAPDLGEEAPSGSLPDPAPDLGADPPSVNPPDPAPGQFFTLSVAIQNRGNAPSPATTLRYYRSTDSAITGDDTEVSTRPLRGLSAPGTSFMLIRLRAPTTRGTYYYGACVEPVDGEVDIGNNCSPAAELVVR